LVLPKGEGRGNLRALLFVYTGTGLREVNVSRWCQ